MKKRNLPQSFFVENRKAIREKLKPNAVAIIQSNDEVLRNGDQNFKYRQNSDLLYLTGINQERTVLVICPDHPEEKYREIIFTIKPNKQLETWTGHKLTMAETTKISGVKTVMWIDEIDFILKNLILNSQVIYLNLNEYFKYSTDVNYRDHRFALNIRDQYPAHQLERLAPIITEQRLIKRNVEIQLIQEACNITGKAFYGVLKNLKPDVKEYEVEAEIIHKFIYNGASGHAYLPIIASGKNALVLHYIENADTCNEGELLLMDFGAEYVNYAADCSRTIPVNGKFTKRQKEVYESVLRVQKEAIKLYTPGNTIQKVNKVVWGMIEKELIKLGLLKKEDVLNQNPEQPLFRNFIPHGVAHFIGLDVHDVGAWHVPFKKGMVLTCEPGIYIEEEGIGIRIEDDILVDEIPVNLMKNIPKEVSEIEKLME